MIPLHGTEEEGAAKSGYIGDGKIARHRGETERTNERMADAIVRGEFDGNYSLLPLLRPDFNASVCARATAVPANAVSNSHSYRTGERNPGAHSSELG